jgi:hypothetical protein
MDDRVIDLIVIVCSNIFNLVIVGVMLSRPPGWKKYEHILGMVNIVLIPPLGLAVINNWLTGREWWGMVLPGLMILFLIVETILDNVLKADFRYSRGLGPYLLIFYIAQWGMIGYSFLVEQTYGFLTLITYFISLGATAYSYAKVRHG